MCSSQTHRDSPSTILAHARAGILLVRTFSVRSVSFQAESKLSVSWLRHRGLGKSTTDLGLVEPTTKEQRRMRGSFDGTAGLGGDRRSFGQKLMVL